MEDEHIVELYWERSEEAVSETAAKYGRYLYSIAYHILANEQDAEECVNDTYSDAWKTIPPHRPSVLSTFLGKITRRIAVDFWRKNSAEKRGGGETALVLEELGECVSGSGSVEDEVERRELLHQINVFLEKLPDTERRIFLCRYWYCEPVSSIAERFGYTESRVASQLYRTRNRLRSGLKKEGY